MKHILILSLSLLVSQAIYLQAHAEESPATLDKLQAARCNLLNNKVAAACFQLGKLSGDITPGNRAEIAPVFSFCYYGGDNKVTAGNIEKFLRASGVIAITCD